LRAEITNGGRARLQRRFVSLIADQTSSVTDNAYFLEDVDITSLRLKTRRIHGVCSAGWRAAGHDRDQKPSWGRARTLGLDALSVRCHRLYDVPAARHPLPMTVEDNILAPCCQSWR
jgi:xanthine dehydrogenase molybdopterin-binding subunit B